MVSLIIQRMCCILVLFTLFALSASQGPSVCFQGFYDCSMNVNISDGEYYDRFNTLKDVHNCAVRVNASVTSCSYDGQRFLNHFLLQLHNAMKYECDDCTMPYMTSNQSIAVMAASVYPKPTMCMDGLIACKTIFNMRMPGRKTFDDEYKCVQNVYTCNTMREWDEHQGTLAQINRTIDQNYPPYSSPPTTAKPTNNTTYRPWRTSWTTTTERYPDLNYNTSYTDSWSPSYTARPACYSHLERCRQQLYATREGCLDHIAYMECLTTRSICQATGDMVTKLGRIEERIGYLKPKCYSCNRGGYAGTTDYPKASSCEDQFNACSRNYASMGQSQWSANEFYKCLLKPQNCQEWEEYQRQELLYVLLRDKLLDGGITSGTGPLVMRPVVQFVAVLLTIGLWMLHPFF